MQLPNGEQAIIDIIKLRAYCLNTAHPRGRHKARVFAAALGITAADAAYLRAILKEAARTGEAVARAHDAYGQRYTVDFAVAGPTGMVQIRSNWIVRQGEAVPRLTSCYVRGGSTDDA
jgi:hypothetical protein